MNTRQETGAQGEAQARKYLKRKGYRILETNVRSRYGEMDIIAEYRAVIVFVEVKTRRGIGYGLPREAVTPRKQAAYVRLATAWLQSHELLERNARFDVIDIVLDTQGAPTITHIENAFEAN